MSPKRPPPFIASTAIVEHHARIGAGTRIWHHAQIRSNARIGTACSIGKDVFVDSGVRIGNRVKIQNGVSVYHGVTVEDDVFLGPHCVTTNDLHPRAFISDFKVTPTRFRRGCSIGAGAVVVCGSTIGRYAMVGAGSVVTHDIPAYGLAVGNPAHLIGFVCVRGHRMKLVTGGKGRDSARFSCPVCRTTQRIPRTDVERLVPQFVESF